MTPSIRVCKPGDEDALALAGAATFLEAYAEVLRGPDIVAHCRRHHTPEVYRGWLQQQGITAWLAETDLGSPVGYAVVTPPDLPLPDLAPDDLELKRIYLLHRFQGAGVGRRLMNAAVEEARGQEAGRLLLGVYGKNEAALGFYARCGFTRIGTRRFQVGDTLCDDFILGLNLSSR